MSQQAIYLTTKQSAELLNLSPKTLETKRCRGGGPPFVSMGRAIRYREADLHAWAAGNLRRSTSDSGDHVVGATKTETRATS